MRKLEECDRQAILKYVGKEPEMNLFFIGDIENYGVSTDQVNIYAKEKGDGSWDHIILSFYSSYILYSREDTYDHAAAAEFLKSRSIECIGGKSSLVRQLIPYFPQYELQSTYMSRCGGTQMMADVPEGLVIRRLTEEDVEEVIDFYMLIEEFAKTYVGGKEKNVKQMLEEIKQGGKIIVGGYIDGRLVALSSTTAGNSMSAMVVGVATHPGERGKGYASAVLSRLCEDSLKEGREFLCLFYDNPAAGRIYNRIGFTELGEYALFR